MTEPLREPNLDDVIDTDGSATPDHREHAKMPHPPNDDALEHRVEQERERLGADGPVDRA